MAGHRKNCVDRLQDEAGEGWRKFYAAERRIGELEAELAALKDGGTYCAYCGYTVDNDDESATKITEHILTCPEHPMREIEHERDALKAELAALKKGAEDNEKKR